MRTLIKIIAVMALLFAFTQCDPGKRIQKICNKHPQVCKRDTITKIIKDSVTIAGIKVDTVFAFKPYALFDTVYLQKEKLLIKYKYDQKTNTVYLSGNVAPQTHVFEHRIQVVNSEISFKKTWLDYLGYIGSFATGVAIMLPFIRMLLRRLTNKPAE